MRCTTPSVPVTAELVLLHGNTCCVIWVDVNQTLIYSDDRSSVPVRQDVYTQVAHGLYEHQTIKVPQLQLWNK
jgi:hypothetical protein